MQEDFLNLTNKTILITGAAGFIGSNLVEYFATYHKDSKILALDCFRDGMSFSNGNPSTLGHFENLKHNTLGKNIEIIPCDITNTKGLKRLFHTHKIHYIFHQAAISDTLCENMRLVLEVNLNAFKTLLHLAKKHGSHIIYASSAATYGLTPPPNSVGENEIPQNIYGYSKLCMDIENARMQEEMQGLGLGLIGLRYFNVYGKREFHKAKTASMVLQLSLQALHNKKVRIFEFGEQMRDFVYIKDVVMANIKALKLIFLVYGEQNSQKDIQKDVQRDGQKNNKKHLLEWQKVHKVFNDSNINAFKNYTNESKIALSHSSIEAENYKKLWLQNGAIYNVGYGEARSFNEMIKILKKELEADFEVEFLKNRYSFFQTHTLADSKNFLPNYTPLYNLESGVKDYIPHIQEIFEDIKQGRKIWNQ